MFTRTYRIEKGEIVNGVLLRAFLDTGNYSVIDIAVYEDGLIDCCELVDVEGFKEHVQEGCIRTTIPKDTPFYLDGLGYVECTFFEEDKSEQDFIKEVQDAIAHLRGEPTSSSMCRDAFEAFLQSPSEKSHTALEQAYQNVPQHLRAPILQDMDAKDEPIRRVIAKGTDLEQKDIDELRDRYYPKEV